ncbi:MAG: ChaN family lipoprotein [Gammaproteobacteria bacterium]
MNLSTLSDLAGVIPELAGKRVVYVGETHTRYDHHLVQLEIIQRLHAIHPEIAVGLEFFQQPFQGYLDRYVAGELSEQELLQGTEYYRRWRYDFRLYAPILRYAREHKLPLVALNLPMELTRKAGRLGLDKLTAKEREAVPREIDFTDKDYERRVREIFDRHPQNGQSFTNFLLVQLLWDEGMAEQAANWLKAHPEHLMVILAGSGHLAYGSGIPQRLTRRLPVSSAIVLNNWAGTLEADLADFLLLPQERLLPPGGKMGVLLDEEDDALTVSSCLPDSACESAGLRSGDRFVSIDDGPIASMPDLRVAIWDKSPGDLITLKVQRKRLFSPPQELIYEFELY